MPDNKQQQKPSFGPSQGEGARRPGLSEAASQGSRAGIEVLREGSEAGADAMRQQAEAGGEAMRRMQEVITDTVGRSAQAVVEGQSRLIQDAADQFQDVTRKVAQAVQGTSEDLRALMVLPSVAGDGLNDLRQSAMSMFEGILRTNVRATQEMFRLANPGLFLEAQQRFAHEYISTLVEGSVALVRATRRAADETLGPLEQRVEHRHAAE